MKNVFAKKHPSVPGTTPQESVSNAAGNGESLECHTDLWSAGVTTDCNKRYRKSMEDTHCVVKNYMDIPDCGFFGVYDGHAGAQSSKACAAELHKIIAKLLMAKDQKMSVVECMNAGFLKMDEFLKSNGINHSGSTAVVAIVGYVNSNGKFVPKPTEAETNSETETKSTVKRKLFVANVGDARAVLGVQTTPHSEDNENQVTSDNASCKTECDSVQMDSWEALRLSYDHKASDPNEQRRISNAGGIVLNNRVNGMLAVSRSLGDLIMKDYVVGAPFTTETDLDAHKTHTSSKQFLIMASDGLWDVCTDEMAVQLTHTALGNGQSSLQASTELLNHALQEFSADNLTVLVVSLN